jgi:hypothetical protein
MFIQLLLLSKHSLSHQGSFCTRAAYWWQSEICRIDLACQMITAAVCLHILLVGGVNQKNMA